MRKRKKEKKSKKWREKNLKKKNRQLPEKKSVL